jgi:uncharacterized protein (TIGR00369 family)
MSNTLKFDQLLDKISEIFTKDMSFMKQFDANTEFFSDSRVVLAFSMNPTLIGNVAHQILHGGAVATILDSVGGMLAMAATFAKHQTGSLEKQYERIAKTATISLHLNYLRPGRGEIGDIFTASADIIRSGRKITVSRLELRNQDKTLLACGTGTYMNGAL